LGQFLLRRCHERVLSLGYCAARLPGFRAALLLGYYVVTFLGYRVESGLGFMHRRVTIRDIVARNQPLAELIPPLSAFTAHETISGLRYLLNRPGRRARADFQSEMAGAEIDRRPFNRAQESFQITVLIFRRMLLPVPTQAAPFRETAGPNNLPNLFETGREVILVS
jgi:hypothetical protein